MNTHPILQRRAEIYEQSAPQANRRAAFLAGYGSAIDMAGRKGLTSRVDVCLDPHIDEQMMERDWRRVGGYFHQATTAQAKKERSALETAALVIAAAGVTYAVFKLLEGGR